ncbi:hypothetical protein JOE59_000388 [Agromyces cerinus]|uniref:hypothetical protein n=1 Tax=Agromyces cerinus TaxID=33878 RepID=UPI00195B3145|nr:hypothetical protein [Agromyces cerinus]MBM7829683.1 hypothetical protein [Agromyces cerinus]
MATNGDNELEARIAALESENAALRAGLEQGAADAAASAVPKVKRRWGRSLTAVVLIVVGLLLAPVAVISAWARLELADTNRFVATFAPIAEDPAVQAYIGDEVTAAIEEQVDIPGLTSDVFDGIRSLGLPPRAETALGLLEGPATQGIQSLVSDVVDRLVTSEAFEDIWANTLRITHTQFVAAMQGDPDAALAIGSDGTISVQLGPIVESVKERLVDQGVGFASAIPEVDRSVVIAQDDAFALIRTIYALAIGVGTWLPWIMLALLVVGVVVARNRVRALVWTAGGFALSMALLASGVGIGRWYFVGAVSSVMPADAAEAIYSGLIEIMMSTVVALLVLGVLVAVVAWFSGPWRPARALRGFAESGFSAVRRSAASHGVTTGRFGIWLDRWRVIAYIAIAVVASLVVLFSRPASAGFVITTVVLALLALLIVELLRRPETEVEAAAAAESEVEVDEVDEVDESLLVAVGSDGEAVVAVVDEVDVEAPTRPDSARPAD